MKTAQIKAIVRKFGSQLAELCLVIFNGVLFRGVVLSAPAPSVRQPKPQLDRPRAAGRGNSSEVWRSHRTVRRPELRVIECAEKLRAELQVDPLLHEALVPADSEIVVCN